jgi:hypothetical protein
VTKSDQAKVATKVRKKQGTTGKSTAAKRREASATNADVKVAVKDTPTPRSQARPVTVFRSIKVPSDDHAGVVRQDQEVPDGLPRKYFLKSTFNTHDIMHAPVEKTLKMLDKILAGERLFTM